MLFFLKRLSFKRQRFDISTLWATGILFILHSLCTPFATASYSIVATDSKTRQVGGAGGTCLADDIYGAFYLSAPGNSVLHTQGWLLSRDDEIIVTAVDMMNKGESPDKVLGAMKALDTGSARFQVESETKSVPEVEIRQYAMADFSSTESYSGKSLNSVFEFLGCPDSEVADVGNIDSNDRYNFHAIGNLVKTGTVNSLQNGFEDQNDEFGFGTCDIAGKLMTAMYRVVDGGFGDVRCLEGRSAAGAYIHVDNLDGTPYIHINEVDSDGNKEPVEVLKDEFLEWRKGNPCESESSGGSRTHVPQLFKILSMFGIAPVLYFLF